jgi:hypothetical protein
MEEIMITQNETTFTPRFTSADLAGSITEKIKVLAEATDIARMSEEMLRYLDTYSRFHQYSIYNVFCILMSFPEATQVAGFQRWKSMGRYVKKGEKGIPILAPILVDENPDDPDSEKVLRGFKVVRVFDVSQTDGEPLPEPPNWKSPEQNKKLEEKLIQFANKRGIRVSVVKLGGETQGVSKGKLIEIDPSAGTKTLIHEIGHEILHRGENRPTESCLRELEAESVAYVVCKHFGLEISSSPNYIALHGADSEMIMGHLERIRKTSIEIIKEIDNEITTID